MYEGYKGKAGLVTGGGSGMGRAMCIEFARAGASVVIADVNEKGGQETLAEIDAAGGKAQFLRCDVSVEADVVALVQTVQDSFGSLDFAVNNAAIELERSPLIDITADVFDRLYAVNVKGVFFCMQQEMRAMAKQGRGAIVNIASMNAFRPQPCQSLYTATKHAVLGLTRNAAIEAAPLGIRINAICPGAIDTPMLQAARTRQNIPMEAIVQNLSLIDRIGRPEEVAKAALWLCSDDASYTYGHALAVDGGYLAR
jgi:NAD(P)-dependent dehydrogenase (short-subunit alcohol dehydrogenase family)